MLAAPSAIAGRHDVSVVNVAVRWVLEQPSVAAAIVGAPNARHLDDNLRVFGFAFDEEHYDPLRSYEGAGPLGDVCAAERRRDGSHGAIVRYNLNRDA